MKSVIVVAPHPDDETLGCGGTLLRHREEGDTLHWLVVTSLVEGNGVSPEKIRSRDLEIDLVSKEYGFNTVHKLGFPTTGLDQLAMGEIIAAISPVFRDVAPEVVYLPNRSDIHTDHKVVFDAVASCSKWFRYGHIKKVLAYETLSETEFCINPDSPGFKPNVFVNIEPYIDKKVEIFKLFKGEGGAFPFPRSEVSIRALAALRGSASGFNAAEAFMLLKERI